MVELRSRYNTGRLSGHVPEGPARVQVRMLATRGDLPMILDIELPASNVDEHYRKRAEAEGIHPQLAAGWQLP